MNNNKNIRLNAVEFKPTAFTPLEYTPVVKDISILNNAMEKRDAYINKASEDLSTIMTATNQMRTSLNSADHKWFDEKILNAENEINNLISRGDYHAAINRTKHIANTFYDAETTGRIKNNLQYEEWKKSIRESKTLNEKDRNYFLNTVKYNYNPIREKEGDNTSRIVGVDDWVANKNPVASMDYATLIANGAKFKTPDRTNQQGGGNILRDEKGNILYDANGQPSLSTSKSWHNAREILTKDSIVQTAYDIAKQSDPSLSGVAQDIESTMWQLSEYDKKLKELDENSIDYSTIISQKQADKEFIEFINSLAANGASKETILDEALRFRLTQTRFAEDLAYDYRTNSFTESISGYKDSSGDGNGEEQPDSTVTKIMEGEQQIKYKHDLIGIGKLDNAPQTGEKFGTKQGSNQQ